MKVIWKGSIAFGLVNIPIELYSAIESHSLGFTLLHETCKTPLQYHRWCSHCKKEVSWDQTVKGIKKSDGTYVVITQEMLHELRPKKTETIEIVEFVPIDQVNVIYLNSHYYMAPSKGNAVAYALFMNVLEKLKKVAIGRFVMRDKEYVCAIQAYKTHMLLTTLHYAYEIRGIEKLTLPKAIPVERAELKLAETLIEKLSVKKFDITKFKDTFAQQIKALLQKKSKKRSLTKKEEPITRKKRSLEDSLKESLRSIVRRPAPRRPAAYAKKRH